MENSGIEAALDEVLLSFEGPASGIEAGLDVDAPELLQLRKACRLLDAARHLEAENGYYTVVIESSFAAIERTLQFYLLENGFLAPDEYVDHEAVYERSTSAGLYDEAFERKLTGLWRENRSRSYYRESVS